MKKKTLIIKMFLMVIGAVSLLSFSSCNQNKTANVTSAGSEDIYTCSMHPQVIEHAPGRCPICGMNLVKKENAAREISEC